MGSASRVTCDRADLRRPASGGRSQKDRGSPAARKRAQRVLLGKLTDMVAKLTLDEGAARPRRCERPAVRGERDQPIRIDRLETHRALPRGRPGNAGNQKRGEVIRDHGAGVPGERGDQSRARTRLAFDEWVIHRARAAAGRRIGRPCRPARTGESGRWPRDSRCRALRGSAAGRPAHGTGRPRAAGRNSSAAPRGDHP